MAEKPVDREVLFERIAAAKTLASSRPHDQEALELAAFMDILHPGHPRTDELVRDAKRKGRRG